MNEPTAPPRPGRIAAPVAAQPQRDDARDAARYQWLRDKWGYIEDEYDGYDQDKMLRIYRAEDDHGWDVDPDSLDAAIDAAMSPATGGEENDE